MGKDQIISDIYQLHNLLFIPYKVALMDNLRDHLQLRMIGASCNIYKPYVKKGVLHAILHA